jgi:drug/metabolite transporter (DMT)-like permease
MRKTWLGVQEKIIFLKIFFKTKTSGMQKIPTQSTRLFLIILATIIAFGLSWPIMKLALQDMPRIWLGVIRLGVATVILFIILIFSRKKFWLTRQDMPLFLSVGLLQMGLFVLLIGLGLQNVEAGRSAILVYTTPLWVTPIAIFVFKESMHKLTALGLMIGLIGVCCLFNPFTFDWHDKTALHGNALLLLAAFAWACVILRLRFKKNGGEKIKP